MTKKKEQTKAKDQKKFLINIKAFFNSLKTILGALIILIVILICFSYHLMKSSKTYMFSGKSEYVTILNGVISLNYDVNVLAGSDIAYTYENDFVVTRYKIGYYVNTEDGLVSLAIKEGKDEFGFSLKTLIQEISAYNISEPYHNDYYFTKEKIKNLENGLFFIIDATDQEGNIINDKVELFLYKVSK